jgi:putative phosphoesterase
LRAAVISDTHMPRGARALPERCVELLRSADAILHAGDFMRIEVLRDLQSYGPPVHAVFGNVDDGLVRSALPETAIVTLGDVRVGMIHIPGPGTGRLERLRRAFPDCHAVVFGHTHMPEHAEHDGFQIFNPGSPTERRRAPTKTMGIATIEGGAIGFELVHLA